MIMMPPVEIQKYITLNEEGVWIYDASMPNELLPQFELFLKQVEEAEKYYENGMK